ncbi:MAG: alpha-2-macroglobulin family protein [Candidatus Cloacimonetes bacterium]|nr:alpha-2-macroglobulin family protein [Candidatus Cloacimonadota bacterium]
MKRLVLLALVVIVAFGCTTRKDQESSELQSEVTIGSVKHGVEIKVADYDLARYVAGHTSGDVKPTDSITIRFAENIVGKELIDKSEDRIKITVTPKISGKAVWEKRNVLIFKPDKVLKIGAFYKFNIDITDLIPEKVTIKSLQFNISVLNQDIIEFMGDFTEPTEEANTTSYYGSIRFLLPTSLNKVRKAAILKINGRKVELTWEGSGMDFTFSSNKFERMEEKIPIGFRIDKKIMEMRDDFVRESSLFSMHEMAVILVKRTHEQENPGIEIQFSDVLDPNQDISGYISVDPDIDINLKKLKNKVLVNGNFEFGSSYKVSIKKGILNRSGIVLKNNFKKNIKFNDENPQVIFAKSGCFLPSGNNKKIQFRSMNVKSVNLRIKHVFENNLNFFLQQNTLQSTSSSSNRYYNSFNRVGVEVAHKKLQLGEVRNEWLLQELDLSTLIPEGDNGLYLVELNFNKEDIYYRGVNTGNDHYYTNPMSNGYYHRNTMISKPLILSDIGLTLKKCSDRFIVYATDIMNAKPISGCKVELKTFQNQVLEVQTTNGDGKAEFSVPDKDAFFVEAIHNGQRTILKTSEMIWNTSNFDVEGVQYSARGIRAYTYAERGVYRPGDPINLSMIFRNHQETLADEHPVEVEIRNPRKQLIESKVLNNGIDGFYNYNFTTNPTDPTGNWNVKIKVGGSVFYHTLKIETVVAERLKIELIPKEENVSYDMEKIGFDLQANFLFGAPGANLRCQVNAEIYKNTTLFNIPRFRTFTFDNPAIKYKMIGSELLDDKLDDNGHITFDWKLPIFNNAPTGLVAKIEATVSESGGRSSKEKIFLPIDPYKAYVGLNASQKRWKKLGKANQFKFILLDPEGKPLVGEEVKVRIYHNRYHWWWQYDNENRHFKDDIETEYLKEIKLISKADPVEFEFTPTEYGRYFLEVTHITNDGEGHSAGQFFWGSYWGNPDLGMQDAGIINLNSDKDQYSPGDVAKIRFDAPKNSMVLVSLERGDEVIEEYWQKSKGGKTTIKVPITVKMVPNIYCSVSIIQPHEQTDNDRPIRMYGIMPINVFEASTRQKITLTAPEVLRPNKKFKCSIQTKDHKRTQFTIAVVDEGLLSLTDHPSPDAWAEFYKKQLLGVKTYDNYGYIIGANKGDIFKSYSIGGGLAFEKGRKKRLSPEETKRFKPVCMFQGPIFTDENGFAEMEFEMPEYMGAVRIMVVATNGNRYGNADKTVEVKQDIVLLPTLPRMLAPGDKFTIPVEVFATEKNVGDVQLSIRTIGPVKILGSKQKTLNFSKVGNERVDFQAEVPMKVGTAKIVISAKSSGIEISSTTDIAIRPLSAKISRREMKICKANKTIEFNVPGDGIEGTNEAYLSISRLPKVDLAERMHRLIRYPYGCIEQTTSSVFPQLYLREFIKTKNFDDSRITNNINKGINRLKKFQIPSGGFSYWPGNRKASNWGTSYAGHFLLAAKEAGYFVPEEMINNWLRFQKSEAKKYNYQYNRYYGLREQLYRLYLLAKGGKPELGLMNYLRENHLKKMQDTERWILAAAYMQAGVKNAAQEILMTTGIIVKDYREMSGTFGSGMRDKAMILDAMITVGEKDKSLQLYLDLSDQISQKRWYSTQSVGYTLLALGRYIQKYHGEDTRDKAIKGRITESNGQTLKVNSNDIVTNLDVFESFGDKVSFKSTSSIKELFVTLNWSGIPLKSEAGDKFDGIKLKNVWKDNKGNIISPKNLKQGDIFTQYITVTNLSNINLKNVALVQLLPSAWEIENERINPDNPNKKMKVKKRYKKTSSNVDYTDIRDDRKMWFFELRRNQNITVEMKIRAVTVGEFFIPATYCEVMYDNRYQARKAGMRVKVSAQ